MDVQYERLIDIGLNVLGYLLAGGLGMLMYSILFRTRRIEAGAPQPQEVEVNTNTQAAVVKRDVNFMDLTGVTPHSKPRSKPAARVASTQSGSGRRNRMEIIQLANRMLQSNTPHDVIKRTLPISDGELALLQGRR